jgi:hypothetical protein
MEKRKLKWDTIVVVLGSQEAEEGKVTIRQWRFSVCLQQTPQQGNYCRMPLDISATRTQTNFIQQALSRGHPQITY